MESSGTPVILFDGVCNLCNASIQFILKYEKQPVFKFATIQSDAAGALVEEFQHIEISDSVLLIENGKLYQESTAALKIARHLQYFWVLSCLIYLPRWMRDPFYRIVARKRYHWFGKRESCMMPSPELKKRFLRVNS